MAAWNRLRTDIREGERAENPSAWDWGTIGRQLGVRWYLNQHFHFRAFRVFRGSPQTDFSIFKESKMLVLSRKRGEKIIIADNITIQVIDVRGKNIRLGIEAPQHIPIVRQELLQKTSVRSGDAA